MKNVLVRRTAIVEIKLSKAYYSCPDKYIYGSLNSTKSIEYECVNKVTSMSGMFSIHKAISLPELKVAKDWSKEIN